MHPTFGREIYVVHDVLTNLPIPMYLLRSLDDGDGEEGNVLQRRFYESELTRVTLTDLKIEKVDYRNRKRGTDGELLYLVKWAGLPKEYSTYMPADRVRQIKKARTDKK